MNLFPLENSTILWIMLLFLFCSIISVKMVSVYKNLSIIQLLNLFSYKSFYKKKYNKIYNVKTVKGYKDKKIKKEDELYINLKKYIKNVKIYSDIELTDLLQCNKEKHLKAIKNKKAYFYILSPKNKRKFAIFNYKLDKKTKKILSAKSIYYLEIDENKLNIMNVVYIVKSYIINGV